MSDIIIANAPVSYQPYLKSGDINNNGKIDMNNKAEAKRAIEAYCEDHSNCEKIVSYFNERGYSYDNCYAGSERKLSITVSLSIDLGGQAFDYSSLSRNVRHVPPHQEDHGAVTNPIDGNGSIGDFSFEGRVGAMVDFWQYAYLNYQFSSGNVNSWESDLKEGPYGHYGSYPPHLRQQYASGENAYTFISTQQQRTHYLTLGFYPYYSRNMKTNLNIFTKDNENRRSCSRFSSALMLEAGLAIRRYEVVRGWDRYASVEIKDTVEDTHVGGVLSLGFQQTRYTGKYFSYGLLARLTGVSFFDNGNFAITLDLGLPFGIHF